MITIHGKYQGEAVFEDDNGLAQIPLRIIPALSHDANTREPPPDRDPGAAWAGRWFDRDALAAVRRDLEQDALLDLDSCPLCVDSPALTTDLRDRPVCLAHAPHDDKDD